MYKVILISMLSCIPNKPEKPITAEPLDSRIKSYCEQSRPLYEKYGRTVDKNCDAALFTALHGLACNYVTIVQFESTWEPGKMCRRPNCSCFDNWVEGTPGSDSEWSKDMATGIQLYLAARPDKKLANRIIDYGEKKDWIVCEAETETVRASKCTMSLRIVNNYYQLADRMPKLMEFEDHLGIIGILVQYKLYGGISSTQKAFIEREAKKEPNNLLFQAAAARFLGTPTKDLVAARLLAFFPEKLPSNKNWKASYLWQRSEYRNGVKNPDWLPAKKKATHPGTDMLIAAWVLTEM